MGPAPAPRAPALTRAAWASQKTNSMSTAESVEACLGAEWAAVAVPHLRRTYAPKCIVDFVHGNTAPVDNTYRDKTGVVVQELCPVLKGDWAF